MKTLLLTLTTAAIAMTFSSCYCTYDDITAPREVKHYDSKGRLVKENLSSGNYNTYHYEGQSSDRITLSTKSKVAPSSRPSRRAYNGDWKPRTP